MITLIIFLTGISHIQAAPAQDLGYINGHFSSENCQVKGADLEANDLRFAQVISIPDLPELEPIEPESAPGDSPAPGNGSNAGGSRNGGGEVRSGAANNRPRGTRSSWDDDDDDSSRRGRGDNDDDD